MKRILISAAAFACVALVGGSTSWADMRKGGVELGAYVFSANFDDDSNIDNDEGFGGRLGILFTERHELEFSFDHVSTEDEFLGFDVDLDTWKAGYIYNFIPDSFVSPFIEVGGGFQNVDIELFGDSETDPMAYGGGGVRFFIGNVFNFRLDGLIQAVFPNDDPGDALYDGILQGGVGWVIGGR
jgi:hypothetical protein